MLSFFNLEHLLIWTYTYSITVFYWLQYIGPEHRTPATLRAPSLCPSKGTLQPRMPQEEQADLRTHAGSLLGQSFVQGNCSDDAGEGARLPEEE